MLTTQHDDSVSTPNGTIFVHFDRFRNLINKQQPYQMLLPNSHQRTRQPPKFYNEPERLKHHFYESKAKTIQKTLNNTIITKYIKILTTLS